MILGWTTDEIFKLFIYINYLYVYIQILQTLYSYIYMFTFKLGYDKSIGKSNPKVCVIYSIASSPLFSF